MEGDAHAPFLPAQLVAIEFEADALRLGDLEWLEVVAQRRLGLGVVADVGGRDRRVALVKDLEDALFVEVDKRDDAFDGAGVGV